MRVAILFGTRPETIKMAPVIKAISETEGLFPIVINSGQHREMVAPLVDWFGLSVDHDLRLMRDNQTPQELLARAIEAIDRILSRERPDAMLVQGDTSTAAAGALAAFHRKIPVGHVEAGLRTGDLFSPFPEEANRVIIGRLAQWHFAPTTGAAAALHQEGAKGIVEVTGNTVVDALLWTAERLGPFSRERRRVLVTTHRRESFGPPMREALAAIGDLSRAYGDVEFVFPLHRNPNVRDAAQDILGSLPNVRMIEPLSYPDMVQVLRTSTLVISDSGGLQEEAPTFGVPILITRESTERPEVVSAGLGTLVGTSRTRIVETAKRYLDRQDLLQVPAAIDNPYGDGKAGQRIAAMLLQ